MNVIAYRPLGYFFLLICGKNLACVTGKNFSHEFIYLGILLDNTVLTTTCRAHAHSGCNPIRELYRFTATTCNNNIGLPMCSLSNCIYASNQPNSPIHQSAIINSSKSFTLCWLPSHRGVIGNERVDGMAAVVIENLPEANTPLHWSDIKLHLKRSARTKWQQDWSTIPIMNSRNPCHLFLRNIQTSPIVHGPLN